MSAKAENLSVRLPADIREQVDQLARLTRRSRSFIINEAVASYVSNRSEFLKEIDSAVKSAEAGTGHSREQVFSWMDAWAAGGKPSLPAPDVHPDK